ncbi:MAG: PD-(D/E)XK nuclease family protein [Lachnospiraceae bacterium]|nr:PD-(D/E)XK nuclease family protein [Lachnospiraceae bacterium]
MDFIDLPELKSEDFAELISADWKKFNKDTKYLKKELNESIRVTEHLMPYIFGKTTDEDFISDWLAFILSPHLNSIGVEPLNQLLDCANIQNRLSETDIVYVDSERPGEYHKTREVFLSTNDRIDFLIEAKHEGEDFVIAIENKVFSGLSKKNQLTSYTKELKRKYPSRPIYMIFLAIRKTIASIDKEDFGDFIPVAHEDFINRIKSIPINPINNLRASFLFCEYIKNMETNILRQEENAMEISNDIIDFICSNSVVINQMITTRGALFSEIRKRIYTKINEECFNSGYENSGIEGSKNWCYWYKKDWAYGNNLHFEVLFPDGSTRLDNNNMIDNEGRVEVSLCVHFEGKTPSLNDVRSRVNQMIKGKEYIPSSKYSIVRNTRNLFATKLVNSNRIDDTSSLDSLCKTLAEEMEKVKRVYESALDELQ